MGRICTPMTTTPNPHVWSVPGLMVLVTACGPGSEIEPIVRRDSAGIEVIDLAGEGWGGQAPWQLQSVVSVGESGRDEYQFGRVADAAIDGRGRILVLDPQAQHVKVYDSTGTYAMMVGGPGEGPGELSRWVTDVMTGPGDTIFVPDYVQSRINVYAPAGAYARTIQVPSRPSGRSWALLEDGSFLFRGITIGRDDQGRFQTWDALLHLNGDATTLDTIVRFDYEVTPLGTRENLRVPLIVNHPSWTRLTDGRIAWSALDRDRIMLHRPDGALLRMIGHAAWHRRPVSASDRETMVSLLADKLQLLGGDRGAANGPNVIAPDALPAVTSVRAGPNGALWVQRMGPVEDIEPMAVNAAQDSEGLGGSTWDIIAADGRYLGAVTVPERFRITRITDDRVLGVTRDELDVERVVLLRMAPRDR